MITKINSFYWSESNAQIYPNLKRLAADGLLSSKMDASSGARQKCIYTMTKKGHQVLVDWLKQDPTLSLYREEILLKLSLGQYVDHKILLKNFKSYHDQLLIKFELYHEIIEHIKKDHAGKPDQFYLTMVYDHVQTILNAKLEWCKKMIKRLSSSPVN